MVPLLALVLLCKGVLETGLVRNKIMLISMVLMAVSRMLSFLQFYIPYYVEYQGESIRVCPDTFLIQSKFIWLN